MNINDRNPERKDDNPTLLTKYFHLSKIFLDLKYKNITNGKV